jgi:cyanophycinase
MLVIVKMFLVKYSEHLVKWYRLLVSLLLVAALVGLTGFHSLAGMPRSSKKGTGRLFIIGGGERTESLMLELVHVSGITASDYVVVLPMASEEPDSAVFYLKKDMSRVGISRVTGMNFRAGATVSSGSVDSLTAAKLIFISGGDQTRFMKAVGKGPVYQAIHKAYLNGTTIAGTSAGAAVMSKKMITGNSLKNPEYTGLYPSIEADDIEITEGLGLAESLIVDQHFLKRQRMNRLLAVSIENPEEICVGIDESTAIVVAGNQFTVVGENQVIVLRNPAKSHMVRSGLLGSRKLQVDILLPGETFPIPKRSHLRYSK